MWATTKMADVEIVESTVTHVRQLAGSLRYGDQKEIESYGFTVNKGLWRSYKGSILRRTALVEGHVAAMWGVCGDPMGGLGQPWLLTSHWAEKISPLRFARVYQQEVYAMLDIFPRLVNYCDAEYDKAIRLLDIIGFRIGEPEPLGEKGALYRKFEIGR